MAQRKRGKRAQHYQPPHGRARAINGVGHLKERRRRRGSVFSDSHMIPPCIYDRGTTYGGLGAKLRRAAVRRGCARGGCAERIGTNAGYQSKEEAYSEGLLSGSYAAP